MSDKKSTYDEHEPIRDEDPLKLPFEHENEDWVDWFYNHRTGVLITVGAYLLLAIGIISARITLKPTEAEAAYYIDLSNLEQLIEEKERLEQEVREMQMLQEMERDYFENIRNAASNEQGDLNSGLKDAQNTSASEIYDEAQALEDKMRTSREAYEKGLKEAENILNNRPASSSGETNTQEQGKQSGNVTVSYSLDGRHAVHLPVPAYQCQGGGMITVEIAVNRNGQVIQAAVSSGSANDPCLREFALKAAQQSRFNTDGIADNRQSGTITYLFVPQ